MKPLATRPPTTRTPRTLLLTNDFGPRIGGIESFHAVLGAWLDDQLLVFTSPQAGDAEHDRSLPYPVLRHDTSIRLSVGGRHRAPTLLPTPAVARAVARTVRQWRIRTVVISALAPLGLLAPTLRAAGVSRIVALSHGHEATWALAPGGRGLLGVMSSQIDRIGVISAATRARIASALAPADRHKLFRLAPPVDHSFAEQPPVARSGCLFVGRLVRQKGADLLIDAWQLLGDRAPRLTIVGDGPQHRRLADRARGLPITFAGALDHRRLPRVMASHELLLVPSRTVAGGAVIEGYGLVAAEALSAGLPVLTTGSGGLGEIVDHRVVSAGAGWIAAPHPKAIAARVSQLLDAGVIGGAGAAAASSAARATASRFDPAVGRAALLAALRD